MIDDLRGIAIVVFITLVAGAIAYAGDRVGHQIGRKRLTLFNIRPRYTSTIIAVGTGMLIALVVTLAAISASTEVRTAIFRLNTIGQQIDALTVQEKALQVKVNSARIIIPIDQALSPTIATFPQNSTPELRYQIAQDYYRGTVDFVDKQYTPQLKKYVPPADLDKRLHQVAEAPEISEPNKTAAIYVVATADHNLFAGDRIDFRLATFRDVRIAKSGEELARGTVPSGPNANLAVVVEQLQVQVVKQLIAEGLPQYFAAEPLPVTYLPDQREMQKMLSTKGGNYAIAAFAAEDIYPHTFLQRGYIPIFVVAQPVK